MEKFYLGLDIGTNSVGIACTDETYRLLRAKGKDLWAVRLFDEAQDASQRRTFRTARRRLQRRRQRIELLQSIFAPYMEDRRFFLRLNNSGFSFSDKDEELKTKFSLFADETYTDKEFHKTYPTVYHLRRDLIAGGEKADLRLYYLALHHIVKYRGHFLIEGEKMENVYDIRQQFEYLNGVCESVFAENPPSFDPELADRFRETALQKKGLKDRKRECNEVFHSEKDQRKQEMIALMLGGKGDPRKIFGEGKYADAKSFSFRDLTDETFLSMAETYGEDFSVLEKLKAIYDVLFFEAVLNGKRFLSEAMVGLYEKHRNDLQKLKKLLRDSGLTGVYDRIFKTTVEKDAAVKNNYVNYIGYTKKGKRKIRVSKLGPSDAKDFYAFLKKILKENEEILKGYEAYGEIMTELESDNCNFLPKILHADNGKFPHQINGAELDEILDRLCRDYPAFAEKDETGFSPSQKIRKIFEFRIPYYVGPLNTFHGKNSWMVRKKEGKITPWNFDEMVDKAASNEEFMRRMTNKCTYLPSKDVLPKDSILYQKYNVLNQLNKLRIDEQPIDVRLKQALYRDLFLKERRVTDKKIKEYLKNKGYRTEEELKTTTLSGKDGDFKAHMGSYLQLKNILGDLVDTRPEIAENIILWHTLSTDKKIVEDLIREKYGDLPAVRENISRLKGLTFKDFGRLSREFLCELSGGENPVTGVPYTVLGELYDTNQNLNEILNNRKYRFAEAMAEVNGEGDERIGYEDVEALYVSPKVRRGIWQALQMIDEMTEAVGRAPDKIFVEVTRHDDEKKPTVSRKKQLQKLYRALDKDARDIAALLQELNREETTDAKLRSERLYLYFLQCGRCAYTGKPIDLGELSTDLYDVDHIVPRSLVKDDSLDNKVLVLREKNAVKSDEYPLPAGFTTMQPFWKMLWEKNLMSAKKYALLTRTDPLSEADFARFINRQLVETNQTVDAVAKLLERKYKNQGVKIVYSKAGNVSDFRQKYEIVKCRETNDLHHARDAYLNIAVGNVYDTRFSNPRDYYYAKNNREGSDELRQYNLKKLFDWNTKGAWDKETSLSVVKKTCAKTSMSVTRYAFVGKGEFYDQTVYPKPSEDGSAVRLRKEKSLDAPRKERAPYSDTQKYGGYSSLNTAYFAVVASEGKKGKQIKTIERVPVLVDYRAKGDETQLLRYFENTVGLKLPHILVPKIKIKSLLSVNGTLVWIAGVTGNQIRLHSATEWFTDAPTDRYVNAMQKLLRQVEQKQLSSDDPATSYAVHTNRFGEIRLEINAPKNLELYDAIVSRLEKPLYRGVSGARSFHQTLVARRDTFRALSVLRQTVVLDQLVKFMKCNAESSDLSLLGEGKNCGILLIGKNITDQEIRLIHQSPCGLTVIGRRV